MRECSECNEPYVERTDGLESGMCDKCEKRATEVVVPEKRGRGRPPKDLPKECLDRLDNDYFCSQAERLLKLAGVKRMTLHYDKFTVTIESM